MPINNLIEFTETYPKTSGRLWQYYRDKPALNNINVILDFAADNINSILFKFQLQVTGQTGNNETKNVEIMVPLKYLSRFLRILEILLISCKISFLLIWSNNSFLVAATAANQDPTFTSIQRVRIRF